MTHDPFLRQLSDLCRSHPTRAKWVFVPGHAIGLTLGDRLARDEGDWANLRFVTPLDIATRMAAPFLLERGIEPSEETLGAALVMRLLLALPEEEGYFRGVQQRTGGGPTHGSAPTQPDGAVQTSMAEALWRTVRELRYAGVRAGHLAARSFTTIPAKQAELVALLCGYERFLESAGVADMPLVFEEALRHREWCPVGARDLVLAMPGVPWPPVVAAFLASLPGERVEPAAPARWPRELAGAHGQAAALDLFHAGGRDAEIEEVFRRIVRSGAPLDQVEIACAGSVPASLVWEKAERLRWPVTLSAGLPAAMTRPGRLLLQFCDWMESHFEAAELRRLLQSGDCWAKGFVEGGAGSEPGQAADGGADAALEEADLSAGQAARLLLKSEAAWGAATYGAALRRLASEHERRASDPEAGEDDRAWNERKGRQARLLLAWVERTLQGLPPAALQPGGSVSVVALADAAIVFLDQNAARWSRLDALGLAALGDALRDLRSLGEHVCALPSALRFLRERVASLTVGRDRPRPGHLHVSALADAGFDGRPLAFVVGLEEGSVFPAPVEDAVLLDEERVALRASPTSLPTSAERQAEHVRQVETRLAALAAPGARVCLSFSCRDTREFRQTLPSRLMLEAFRLQHGHAGLGFKDLEQQLGDPRSAVARPPGEAITDGGWWLAHAGPSARPRVLRAFPSLQRGLDAAIQRASSAFTEYDGFVPAAGPLLDPSRSPRPFSATSLERAAKCPLRFFMERGLGVRPIEEPKADQDAWLAPMTKGGELHALYARLLRAVRAEGRKVDLRVDQPRLLDWGRERLDALRAEVPPPSQEVYARESREFLEDLDAFIVAECEGHHGEEPVGFEVPFGFAPEDGEVEPLADGEPLVVKIGDGRQLALHGWIDRVNRLGEGRYEVADYKSSYWHDEWRGAFAGGTRLQHAIYGSAAARALRRLDRTARVTHGTYLFPTVRGHGARKRIPAPSHATLVDVLRDLADVIAIGAFAAADVDRSCKWCDFKAACHADLEIKDGPHAAAKVEDETNQALDAYRRLRGHQ